MALNNTRNGGAAVLQESLRLGPIRQPPTRQQRVPFCCRRKHVNVKSNDAPALGCSAGRSVFA